MSAASRIRCLVASAALLSSLAVKAQTQQVPGELIGFAAEPPETFIQYLVELSVPAGAELRNLDVRRLGAPIPRWQKRQDVVPIDKVIDAFNDKHPEYEARIVDGVFVIRSSPVVPSFLDEPAPPGQFQAKSLYGATQLLFSPLPFRKAGGTFRGEASGRDAALGDVPMAIELNTTNITVIDILNVMIKRAPRNAWLVDVRGSQIHALTYLRPNATIGFGR